MKMPAEYGDKILQFLRDWLEWAQSPSPRLTRFSCVVKGFATTSDGIAGRISTLNIICVRPVNLGEC